MKRIVLALVVAISILAVPPASAQSAEIQCGSGSYTLEDLQIAEQYNNNLEKIPEILQGPLKANTVEVIIENSTVPRYHFETNESREIVSYGEGPAEDEDVRLYIEKAAACRIIESDDPPETFTQAYKDGEIDIEGNGVVKSAQVFVVERVLDVTNALGLW